MQLQVALAQPRPGLFSNAAPKTPSSSAARNPMRPRAAAVRAVRAQAFKASTRLRAAPGRSRSGAGGSRVSGVSNQPAACAALLALRRIRRMSLMQVMHVRQSRLLGRRGPRRACHQMRRCCRCWPQTLSTGRQASRSRAVRMRQTRQSSIKASQPEAAGNWCCCCCWQCCRCLVVGTPCWIGAAAAQQGLPRAVPTRLPPSPAARSD